MKKFNPWIPFAMLLRREVHRFFKVLVQTVVTPFISSFLYLMVFGITLGSSVEAQKGFSYLAFLIPGLCMMGLMNNAFQNSSSSITIGKFTGELEDLKVLPLGHHQIIWAMALASVVRGTLVGLITFFVGSGFHYYQYGEWLGVAHPGVLLFFVLVGGLTFGMLGITTAFWAKTFDQLSAVSAFVLLPLTYLGGVFISIDHLHPFWQGIAKLNPLLYLINGVRYGILGVSDVPMESALVISVVGLVIFYKLADRALRNGSFGRW
jgi:ABC-2 type transport system permease protein